MGQDPLYVAVLEGQPQQIVDVLPVRNGVSLRQVEHDDQPVPVGDVHLFFGEKVGDAAVPSVTGSGVKQIRLEAEKALRADLFLQVLGRHRRLDQHQGAGAWIAADLLRGKAIGRLKVARRLKRKAEGESMHSAAGRERRPMHPTRPGRPRESPAPPTRQTVRSPCPGRC